MSINTVHWTLKLSTDFASECDLLAEHGESYCRSIFDAPENHTPLRVAAAAYFLEYCTRFDYYGGL